MFFAGSRYPYNWLNLGVSGGVPDEGNPINAASFFLLIAAGVFVLSRRKIDWAAVPRLNMWVLLYLLYCGLSIAWSDYSFIAFKRWFKDLGNPIMVLVILTEKYPYQAMGVVLKRLAFLWLPLSVLFNRYYPEWSRNFSPGGMSLGGVAGEKNALGMICLISGIFFSWHFLINRKKGSEPGAKNLINDLVLMVMIAWLLREADSATSFGCLLVVVGLLIFGRTTLVMKRPVRIMIGTITAAFLYFLMDAVFGIRDNVIEALGRDPTLTNRTTIWEIVKEFPINPFVGAGYQSFWAGDRLKLLWERIGANINQAHNGYLEQYLNLGYVGTAFVVVIILSGLFKVRRHLDMDYSAALLRLCFIVAAVLYNYTEASFYGLSNMWLLLLFAIVEMPFQHERKAGVATV